MRIKEIFLRRPISIILTTLLFTDLIIRFCDYLINRDANPDIESAVWISNYSLRFVPIIPIIIFVVVGLFVLLIFRNSNKSDFNMLKDMFGNGCVFFKIIVMLFLILVLECVIGVSLEKISTLSKNYAINSLDEDACILISCGWFVILIMRRLLNGRGLYILGMICPAIVVFLLYRVIISGLLVKSVDEWADVNGLDTIAGIIGGSIGLLLSVDSFLSNLINAFCCILMFSIWYILYSNKKIVCGKIVRVAKISMISGVTLFIIGLTPVSGVFSFIVAVVRDNIRSIIR